MKRASVFTIKVFDEMIKNGMEPLVTISHYEMPLNLCTSYNGWLSRELIDFYTRYCKTIFERYSGKVRYWILMNQVNCIDVESFNTLGILSDRVENLEEAKYQALTISWWHPAAPLGLVATSIRILNLAVC